MGKIILPAILALIVVLSGCMQDLQSLEKGNPSAAHKVLVAGVGSEFKNQVVMKVIQALSAEDCYIKIVSPDKLSEERTAGYTAILLLTSMMAGQFDSRVVRYIAATPADSRFIVFCTSGDEDHPPTDRLRAAIGKIDAVTSASMETRIDQRAREIAELIRKRW